MFEEDLPSGVQNFLAEHIQSVGDLEVLLLLKSNANRSWTAETIALQLRTNQQLAVRQLKTFESKGFLSSEGNEYRYAPRSEGVDQQVSNLQKTYQERKISVINFIYSERLTQIRELAKAFIFRKDPNDG